jgi:hypothetical protein
VIATGRTQKQAARSSDRSLRAAARAHAQAHPAATPTQEAVQSAFEGLSPESQSLRQQQIRSLAGMFVEAERDLPPFGSSDAPSWTRRPVAQDAQARDLGAVTAEPAALAPVRYADMDPDELPRSLLGRAVRGM